MALLNSKINKFILAITSLFSLASCNNNINEKVQIEGSAFNESYIDISNEDLKSKINNHDSFLLYVYSPSCISCQEFSTIIDNYIKLNEVVIYGINSITEPIEELDISFKMTPTLILFEKGEIIFNINPESNPETFVSSSSLKEYLSNYISISTLKILNDESELDKVIKNGGIIYFSYSKCADCNSFNNLFLNNYLKANNTKIYVFDMTYYFDHKNDGTIYKDFADKYGLSKDGNQQFGYLQGVVPTFQFYKDNALKNAIVIFNDVFENTLDDNNEVEKIKIVSSYFTDNPFINKEFYRTEKMSAKDNYRIETLDFYIKKFELFVSSSLL